MISFKSWALTGVLGLFSVVAVVAAAAPAAALPVGCYKCFYTSGGGGTMGCKSGYTAGGSGCVISGSSCGITGQCGV